VHPVCIGITKYRGNTAWSIDVDFTKLTTFHEYRRIPRPEAYDYTGNATPTAGSDQYSAANPLNSANGASLFGGFAFGGVPRGSLPIVSDIVT
jgi:hypothetical protein